MKILLDTSVLIAGFISRGHVFDLIKDAGRKHTIYYTDFILTEFKRTLSKKFSLPKRIVASDVKIISTYFTKGISAISAVKVCRDPNDDQILADALANKVDIIISGDKDLLVLKKYEGVHIISPKEYWSL